MPVLEIGEVRLALNIQTGAQDAQLGPIMATAIEWVEDRCGPLTEVTITKRVPGGSNKLVLPLGPVVSVTTVTGKSGDVTVLEAWQLNGQVVDSDYVFSEEWYDVEYVYGRSTVPSWGKSAALEMVRHLFRPNQGPGASRQGEAASQMASLRLAEELIKGHRRVKAGL